TTLSLHDALPICPVPLGHAVDTVGVVGHAALVHPAIDLGVGGCGGSHEQERHDERWDQNHWAHHTVHGIESGRPAVAGKTSAGGAGSRRGLRCLLLLLL